jgi:hypothetical protein
MQGGAEAVTTPAAPHEADGKKLVLLTNNHT